MPEMSEAEPSGASSGGSQALLGCCWPLPRLFVCIQAIYRQEVCIEDQFFAFSPLLLLIRVPCSRKASQILQCAQRRCREISIIGVHGTFIWSVDSIDYREIGLEQLAILTFSLRCDANYQYLVFYRRKAFLNNV